MSLIRVGQSSNKFSIQVEFDIVCFSAAFEYQSMRQQQEGFNQQEKVATSELNECLEVLKTIDEVKQEVEKVYEAHSYVSLHIWLTIVCLIHWS